MIPSKLKGRSKKKRSSVNQRRRLQRNLEQLESRQLLASLAGEVWADANGDGFRSSDEGPAADIRVYVDANDDGQLSEGEAFTTTDEFGAYAFDQLQAGSHVVRLDLRFGQHQTSPTAYFGVESIAPDETNNIERTQLFELSSTGEVRRIGTPTSDLIHGVVRTNAGDFIGVNFHNDSLYVINDQTGQETLLSTPGIQFAAGLAYDPAEEVLYAVGRDGTATNIYSLYTVDQQTGTVSAVGSGMSGLQNVSDLTFDTSANRIVGFDDSANQFFEFDIDGTGTLLAAASRQLDSSSLAFNGTNFVMVDGTDPDQLDVIQVNPDTGAIVDFFETTTPLAAEGLTYPSVGDVAQRVTLITVDSQAGLDFGVVGEPSTPNVVDRTLLINELLIDPLFGNKATDQAVEIRGLPNAIVPSGTYLVVVEEDGFSPGSVHGIFDLSNLTLGSNGFLVLLAGGSPHATNPNSSVLQSSEPGFGQLPGDIYSDSHTLTDTIDFIVGSNGFMLIQSDVAPQLGDDVDVDDDGFADPDGVISNWDVLDSISLHPFVGRGDQAYTDVIFTERGTGTIPDYARMDGVEVIVTEGMGYAARIGDSFGSTADDWVVGTIRDEPDAGLKYGFESGIFGVPIPMAFQGRDLDHFGESNFVGGVRGTVQLNPVVEGDDFFEPAQGVVVLADTNGNGRRDILNFELEPDNYQTGEHLINTLPGVTLNTARSDGSIVGFEVNSQPESFFAQQGNKVFSSSGINWFSESGPLRADFYRPARSVSIDGISGGSTTFIRLDAYDVDGNLINSVTSQALTGSQRQRLTVSAPEDSIAYALAYSADSHVDASGNTINGSSLGRLDRFGYTQSEAIGVTNELGFYEITNLFPDRYDVTFFGTGISRGLNGAQPVPIVIGKNENFFLSPNPVPVTEDLLVSELPENSEPGSLGTVPWDDDGTVVFSLLSGAEFGFEVDQLTGELTIGADANLNFEETPEIEVVVAVTDELGAVAESTVTIELKDLNETPIIQDVALSILESTQPGTPIGLLQASDPDVFEDQTLTYRVVGGTGDGAFEVQPDTGLVTLVDSSAIDFETQSELTLRVAVSDDGTPVQEIVYDQKIAILDTNDAPTLSIDNTTITIPENSSGVIGTLEVLDEDVNDEHFMQLENGSGLGTFELRENGDIAIVEGAVVDFESRESFTLEFSVIDSGIPPLSDTLTVMVNVTGVNEPAELVVVGDAEVGENASEGDVVATLSILDPENAPDNYAVNLVSSDASGNYELLLDPLRLVVAENAQFDFEVARFDEVELEIEDLTGGSPPATIPVTINVLNQNDPPTFVERTIRVSEQARLGVDLDTLRFSDPDPNESFVVSIIGGTGMDEFDVVEEIDALGRVIAHHIQRVEGSELDADGDEPSLTLDISVTDSGGLEDTGTITILLNNVNEPPVFDPSKLTLPTLVSGTPFEIPLPDDFIVDPEGGEFEIKVFEEVMVGSGEEAQILEVDPDWFDFDPIRRTLTGLPNTDLVGTQTLTIRAFEFGSEDLATDSVIAISVEAGEKPLTNLIDPLDVDNNQLIRPSDALSVINFIAEFGVNVSASSSFEFAGFLDVNNDGRITPGDALAVIDAIAAGRVFAGQAESITSDVLDSSDNRDDVVDAAITQLSDSTLF